MATFSSPSFTFPKSMKMAWSDWDATSIDHAACLVEFSTAWIIHRCAISYLDEVHPGLAPMIAAFEQLGFNAVDVTRMLKFFLLRPCLRTYAEVLEDADLMQLLRHCAAMGLSTSELIEMVNLHTDLHNTVTGRHQPDMRNVVV